MISSRQSRAIRNWLGWTQSALSRFSGVYRGTIIAFEKGQKVDELHVAKIQETFKGAGVVPNKSGSIVLKP